MLERHHWTECVAYWKAKGGQMKSTHQSLGSDCRDQFYSGWCFCTRGVHRNWCWASFTFEKFLDAFNLPQHPSNDLSRQTMFQSLFTIMSIDLVKLLTVKPQDKAVKCMYYRGWYLTLVLSSQPCGLDGHIFSYKKRLAGQNFWPLSFVYFHIFFMLLTFKSPSILSLIYMSIYQKIIIVNHERAFLLANV